MAQSSDLDLNSIQVVEIPVQIKEEKLFLDGHRIEPEVHKDPVDDIQPEREQVHSNVGEKKRTAVRTRFSIYQRAELEAAFTASPYLSAQRRIALAERLRVTPVVVQSWFKNRRFKWRKEAREGTPNTVTLPAAPAYLPFIYQPPCAYGTNPVPASRPCQGCLTGQPAGEFHAFADFSVYPHYPH
ncbi:retina and anterior neural fold homeobox protein 2-like [Orbicella faveolata]|uniref:retina and anterior neural fold homeobox protein 2-like n=1 Tax=Orbicella faveolata TaxID=48498 RepID=UPI0009E50CBF|nr:retina and anterior neural fold homeobox protein 2-like [Orbicella faveolata]